MFYRRIYQTLKVKTNLLADRFDLFRFLLLVDISAASRHSPIGVESIEIGKKEVEYEMGQCFLLLVIDCTDERVFALLRLSAL